MENRGSSKKLSLDDLIQQIKDFNSQYEGDKSVVTLFDDFLKLCNDLHKLEESSKKKIREIKINKEDLEEIKSSLYLYFTIFMKQEKYMTQLGKLSSKDIEELIKKLNRISELTRDYNGKNAADYQKICLDLINTLKYLAKTLKISEVSEEIDNLMKKHRYEGGIRISKLDDAQSALEKKDIKLAINLLYSRLKELKAIDEIVTKNNYEQFVQDGYGNVRHAGDISIGLPAFTSHSTWGTIAKDRGWFDHYGSYLSNSNLSTKPFHKLLQTETYENLVDIRKKLAEIFNYIQTTGANQLVTGQREVNRISHENFYPTLKSIDFESKEMLNEIDAILVRGPKARQEQLEGLALAKKQTQDRAEVEKIYNIFKPYSDLANAYKARRGVFKKIFTPQRSSRNTQVSELGTAIKKLLAICKNFPEVGSKEFSKKFKEYKNARNSIQETLIKVEKQFAVEESTKKYFQASSLEALCKDIHESLDSALGQKTYQPRVKSNKKH